ncbi:hypothetical protein EDD86DRAFT_205162 [Gorgonomyces haynaldii]|nr:hypothetical protein EDD86DRAFT_205162 [Gorgonomyces haynaldii]
MSFNPPAQQPPMGIDPSDIYRQPVAMHPYHMVPPYYQQMEHQQDYHIHESPQMSYQRYQEPLEPSPDQEASGVYCAVYSGVPVFEMVCRNIAVMRRRVDSFLNATQILKVAGIDKGRRTKILEKEIQNGPHEKVQGGYGKYQGTWIPFERGVELAHQFGVQDVLGPILNYNPPTGRQDGTPTKEQMLSGRPIKKTKKQRSMPFDYKRKNKDMEMSSHSESPHMECLDVMDDPRMMSPYHLQNFQAPEMHYMHPNLHMQIEPPSERHRTTIMAMFMSEDDNVIPDILLPTTPLPSDFDIDLVLDDQGHSALHWAAALGSINLLNLLIQKGANPRRLNFNGETALMRAVMVSNNYDRMSFPSLLSVLKDQISYMDKKGRNVLHHICLSASLKAGANSCRYYLECALEHIAHQAEAEELSQQVIQGSDGQNTLPLRQMLNASDINGDTPINIAARVGNHFLVDQLLHAGADPKIPNRVGLRPADFGYDHNYISGSMSKHQQEAQAEPPRVVYPSIQAEEDTQSVVTVNDMPQTDAEVNMDQEMNLREMSKQLAKARKQNLVYKEQLSQLPQLLLRINNLEQALAEKMETPSTNLQPLELDAETRSNPHLMMDRLQQMYQQLQTVKASESKLIQELINLKSNNGLQELQCKRIISVCCGVDISQVSEIIQPLLEAIESDEQDVDVGAIASFMTRVRDDTGLISPL